MKKTGRVGETGWIRVCIGQGRYTLIASHMTLGQIDLEEEDCTRRWKEGEVLLKATPHLEGYARIGLRLHVF